MKKYLPFLFLLVALGSRASTGDTIRVMTHDTVLITTDPGGSGHTEYPRWGVFPSSATKYSKVLLRMKFACPNVAGLTCGEWDYLNWIYVRRTHSVNDTSKNVSLATFITPYGHFWPNTWNFEWVMDVTDYSPLLHDSVEIEYDHTGYEASNDRGWRVTLEFICIEGQPGLEPIRVENLYNGSYCYGCNGNSIENFLTEKTVTAAGEEGVLRFRINQTGHGSDGTGCGEFCNKLRTVYWDSGFVEQAPVWRYCGINPLFPQYGTWLYDRANWCPGAPVKPSTYDFVVAGNSTHKLNVDMEDYIDNGAGNYMITSQVIHFKPNIYTEDAELYDVIAPSDKDEMLRFNPVCANPKVIIKNNGSNPLTKAEIKYGIQGDYIYTYFWNGYLKTNEKEEVDLPNLFYSQTPSSNTFTAWIDYPNGLPDNYNYNDTARTFAAMPPVHDSTLIVVIKTNKNPQETTWKIYDSNSNVVDSNNATNYANLTVYRDTLHLTDGCYELDINDAGGDGLDFNWANGQGVGFIRLTRINNQVIKSFPADFGSGLRYQFYVGQPLVDFPNAINETAEVSLFEVYPNPTSKTLNIDAVLTKAEDTDIEIYDLVGRRLLNKHLEKFSSGITQYDFSGDGAGIYFVRLHTADKTIVKKVVVSK